MRLIKGILTKLAVVALIAAPLSFATPANAESGCHRGSTPAPPPATSDRNG